jgi:hypothetical protein
MWKLGTSLFLLRAELAELHAQFMLWRSGLGQPPGREIGDGFVKPSEARAYFDLGDDL